MYILNYIIVLKCNPLKALQVLHENEITNEQGHDLSDKSWGYTCFKNFLNLTGRHTYVIKYSSSTSHTLAKCLMRILTGYSQSLYIVCSSCTYNIWTAAPGRSVKYTDKVS